MFASHRHLLVGWAAVLVCSALAQSFAQEPDASPTKPGPVSGPEKDAGPPPYVDKVDSIPGFRGMKFGQAVSDADGLVIEQDRGPLKLYKKAEENLMIGAAHLETVLYYFYEGKLYGVALHTDDGQDTLVLKQVLNFALGMGEGSQDGGPATFWIGKENGVLFDMNPATGDGSVFLFDQKLHDAYLTYESTASEKAATQLIQGE